MMRYFARLTARVLILTLAACTSVVYVLPVATTAADAAPAPREGCLQQWMFNGVWRVRVTAMSVHVGSGGVQDGWVVSEEWRNGTDRALSPGPDTFSKAQQITLSSGKQISTGDSTTATLSQQVVDYHEFPPAAPFKYQQIFLAPPGAFDVSDTPAAVSIAFDSAKLAEHPRTPQFSVKPADYKIKFGCSAAASAANDKNAQGGSYEVQAQSGCLNQWMFNGIWRVRITGVEPNINDSGKQTGWAVSEEWVNASKATIEPIDVLKGEQQLILASGDTIASTNSTGSTLTEQKLDYHDFAPGASFSHKQTFILYTDVDPSNKPVKLLLLFDAKGMKERPNKPQYAPGIANFRIAFKCSK